MSNRKIAPVSDNNDKFLTYTELTRKYNIASVDRGNDISR